MLRRLWIALAVAAGAVLSGCAGPEKRAEVPAAAPAEGARITQFYTTQAQVARGETALVCYGVQNAKAVWLEPPRHELSAALTRCVEVSPAADTNSKLTAGGEDRQAVSRDLRERGWPARAKIV